MVRRKQLRRLLTNSGCESLVIISAVHPPTFNTTIVIIVIIAIIAIIVIDVTVETAIISTTS